ncbi:MAG TPA: SUMF1/EgtB/PvdO family nonheme iron enzyme [Steroidobacteraceae bacterium]|jgi:sulfatase modifying factor 1|nr:SUMF1/EgtB/PvdO family nonheme iron enzyme [Steroidobacteraceae bacterium]
MRSTSSPVLTFEKVLRAYGTGGFTYADVMAQLERLLAIGASPAEMLEILRRRERIEPFPEYAHVEVVRLLNAAIARDAAEAAANVELDPDAAPEPDSGADAQAEPAETSDSPSKLVPTLTVIRNPGSPAALPNTLVSADSTRGLQQQVARQLADYEMLTRSFERLKEAESTAVSRAGALAADLAALRGVLESEQTRRRDAERALAERDAQLAALQHEHAKTGPLLEARARTGAQLEANAQAAQARYSALSAELEGARHALQIEQGKCRDTNRELSALRDTLAAREAQLTALQQEQAKAVPLLEARAKTGAQLEANAQATQARNGELAAALAAARNALQSEQSKSRDSNKALAETRAQQHQAEAMASELKAQVARLRSQLDANQARLSGMRTAASTPAPREPSPEPLFVPSVSDVETRPLAGASAPATRSQGWNLRSGNRPLIAGFALVLLAIAAWFFSRHTPEPKQAAVTAPAAMPAPGTVIHDCPTCPSMVVLPTGRFKQGAVRAENASPFEMPIHWVVIGRPLSMSANPVTVDEFQQFIAATGRDVQGCDIYDGEWKNRPDSSWKSPGFSQSGTHPVTCVSWNDAQAYARWLSTATGHQYRLPSASEWEYAARSGGEAVQPWNANGSAACADANVADASAAQRYPGWTVFACNDGYVYTSPVGSFKANAFGLNDMLGNVFQWTEDCWHPDYVGAPIDGSARSGGDCSERELRGGSWFSTPAYVRANYRNHFAADYRTSSAGFRLVREP